MASRKNDKYIKGRRGKLITLLIASFVLLLSVGYTALNEELTISGEASFRVEEDIRVTGINILQPTNSALEEYNPTYGKDSIKVGVTLPSNQSTVTYKVKIANYSNVAMKIAKIDKVITNNNYTITFNKTLPLTIGKLSEEEIEITFKNNTSASQIVESTLQFTFEKLESMMTVGNNNAATSTFYRGPIAKNTVESITFMSTKEIPEDAVGYWDCSYVQGSNEVMAYYLNSETEGMYDLYIAADGEVYAPENSARLFKNFSNLVSIDFNNVFKTTKATSMSEMFREDSKLSELNLYNFNTSNVTNMGGMFYKCSSLKSLIFGSKFDTSNVTIFSYVEWNQPRGMFQNCSSIKELDLSSFDVSSATEFNRMFNSCSALTKLDLSNFHTSNVTSMLGMFSGCKALTELNLSNFDTANVTDMMQMFSECSSLTYLNVDSFRTQNVENMHSMFNGCSSLTSIDLSKFDTSNVTNMASMFKGCKLLTELDLSNFNTEKVTTMNAMFQENYAMLNLNISSFIISDGIDITGMFRYNHLYEEIDIRSFDFKDKTITQTQTFYSTRVKKVYVKDEYNKDYIQSLLPNANVIIALPEVEEIEES